ncbi:hypothetical protein WG66_006124 [Moniliophthora roreri]|nr:hypothetical protein WG66_006124 [Moniliophthora roreri]
MIEGLSILASITRNSSIENMLRQAVSMSTNQIGSWLQDDGVFTERAITSTSENFAHSIGVVARRNVAFPNLALYANDLLSVQYNAILEQATEGGNGIYGGLWTGPPSSKFQRWFQSSACYVLMAAIALPEKGSSTKDTGTDSPTSSVPNPTKQNFPVGGIVGVVVGAVLILALTAFLFRLWKRQTTAETVTEKSDTDSDGMIPVPFMDKPNTKRPSKILNGQHPITDETGPRTRSDGHIVPRLEANSQRNMDQYGTEELDNVQEMSRSGTRHPRRHEDSGWRPDPRLDSESFDDLPPTYENAL